MTGQHRINFIVVLRLAPGRSQGRAAGVNVAYRLGGHDYLIPFQTAVILVTGNSCPA